MDDVVLDAEVPRRVVRRVVAELRGEPRDEGFHVGRPEVVVGEVLDEAEELVLLEGRERRRRQSDELVLRAEPKIERDGVVVERLDRVPPEGRDEERVAGPEAAGSRA